ncbi:MAG: hypothetical protein IJ743_01175 [Bacilli bacterium]|nr:hypothetical protein [Bacilli bacterium]MBR1817256.1 hypothetical protein [Bacilli bacterium]
MKNRNTLFMIGAIVLVVAIVGSYFFFSSKKEEEKKSDAILFKEEYESLNGKETSDGKVIRVLSIDSNNPFVYQTAEEIVSRIEKKETFAIYFGFKSCPWCRSVLPTLIEVAKDLHLSKIYYVDVSEIRDQKELQDGKVVTTKEGSEGYQKLLTLLDKVLEEFTLEDENHKKVDTHEKRIYAPNIVSVVNGTVDSLTTGISKKLTDPYMQITDDMKSDMYNQIKCTLECVKENEAVCTKKAAC